MDCMSVTEYPTKKEVDILKALKHLKRIKKSLVLQHMDLLCYSDSSPHVILQKAR